MNIFNKWKENIAQYFDVRIRLIKLSIIEKTSGILSYIIFSVIMLFITMLVLLFFGIGLAETFTWLFDGNRIAGYFAAMGLFIFLALLLVSLRKSIVKGFSGIFVRMLTAEDDIDEEQKREIDVE